MLTEDKTITSPEYWNKIYSGKNDNAKVDASNTTRPANTFDRFGWVAKYATGPHVLEVAAGHAHVSKRIKAAHPEWLVVASDQASDAVKVANYPFYKVFSAYEIPYNEKEFNTIICCQAMEYMEDQERFLNEAKRVSYRLLISLPQGEMKKWSQLRIYTEENLKELLQPYGEIEIFYAYNELFLVKLRFND
jgi:ubiquinone/menaquinone biosynthesis C-methylase UbiE